MQIIRATCRARSHAEFVAKIGYVVEEADESLHWLDMIEAAGIGNGPDFQWLMMESKELAAIFNQSQLTAKANAVASKRDRTQQRGSPVRR